MRCGTVLCGAAGRDKALPQHTHGRGEFFKPQTARNGNESRFPRATCIFGNFCLRTKSKSAKFRIRWSEVPRVLARLDRVTAILDVRPACGAVRAVRHAPPVWAMGRAPRLLPRYCRRNEEEARRLGMSFTVTGIVQMCSEAVMKCYEIGRQRYDFPTNVTALHVLPLFVYTYEIEAPGNNQIYSCMNRAMREGTEELIGFWLPLIWQLHCVLHCLPIPDKPLQLYRGVNLRLMKDYKAFMEKRKPVTWAQFSSSSTSEKVAQSFLEADSGASAGDGGSIFLITAQVCSAPGGHVGVCWLLCCVLYDVTLLYCVMQATCVRLSVCGCVYLSGTFRICQRGANSCIFRVFSIFRPEYQNFIP